MKVLIAAGSICLSACALITAPGEPVARKVNVEGEPYLLSQLTASTWAATTPASAGPRVNSASSRAALLLAIEHSSGCKVTDSNYSRDGLQLDAQVDCGSRLKN